MNITEKINQSGYDIYFLVVDEQLSLEMNPELINYYLIFAYKNERTAELKRERTPYFCLEEGGVDLREKNSGRLLESAQVKDYIRKNSANSGHKIAIMAFKPSAKLEKICQTEGWLLIANKTELNRSIEDKIKFAQLCSENNIPVIPYRIEEFNMDNFKSWIKYFGSPVVIQSHFGWAGNSTFMANSWKDVLSRLSPGVRVKISPLLDGYTLLNNCCLWKGNLIQSPAAMQYNGIKDLSSNPFTTVGRQWPSHADNKITQKIFQISQKLSDVLNRMEYRGYFGIDFFVSQGEVYVLECNPRLTASFAFYNKLESEFYPNSLLKLHIAEFLNIKMEIDVKAENLRAEDSRIVGSEITKRNQSGQVVKKINAREEFSSQVDPIRIKDEILNLLND